MKEIVCEMYISEKPFDIPYRIKEFALACEFLLKQGVNTFHVHYQDVQNTSLCIQILKLYQLSNPNMKILKKRQKSNDKVNNVLIFNFVDHIVVYDENFAKIYFTNGLEGDADNDKFDFSKIDLMP